MRVLNGMPENISSSIMGRVTRREKIFGLRRDTVLLTDSSDRRISGHVGVISTSEEAVTCRLPVVHGIAAEEASVLGEGDVVLLEPDGTVKQLWDADSAHNVVMVTNTCNCRCMMCPQPSCKDPDGHMDSTLRMLRLAGPQDISLIGLTGGEPTLRLDYLCRLLNLCKGRFRNAHVSLLTNGRAFHDFDKARQVALVRHPNLTHCVSLQADIDSLHDEIMGAPGSFRETVAGLHNLAKLRQRIEIRVVISRQNYTRLPRLAEFVYRNFPFVSHIALMGLEITGLALQNVEAVWADPVEYGEYLDEAVRHLHRRDMVVSIYNLPLCLLPRNLWAFARDSISDWKKAFLPQCVDCQARISCCGVFGTSERHSKGIAPIENALCADTQTSE